MTYNTLLGVPTIVLTEVVFMLRDTYHDTFLPI